MASRQPRAKGLRPTSAPSLLGGLVRCDCETSCALTTATGTSRTGKIYAYYKCIQATKQVLVDAVIVSKDKIRIIGPNDNIRSTFGPTGQLMLRVRKSVQEWCPGAGCPSVHLIEANSIT